MRRVLVSALCLLALTGSSLAALEVPAPRQALASSGTPGVLSYPPGPLTRPAVSQTAQQGSGTRSDPFTVTTQVRAGATGVEVTQTDSYVAGDESYRTLVSIRNSGAVSRSVLVYRAGDCYLANSDYGFGVGGGGAIACQEGVVRDGVLQPGSRIQQWTPLTPGSSWR